MKNTPNTIIKRPTVAESYTNTMAEFLVRTKGWPKEKAVKFVRKNAADRFQDRKLQVQASPSPGNVSLETINLHDMLDNNRDNVITPSGSIYINPVKKEGFVRRMVDDQGAQRKIAKKEQFKAKEAGDDVKYNQWYYRQTLIKINMNALPGGFGSAYNIFYDKGGYNTITSMARALIAVAIAGAEQLLGGNFCLFDEHSAINHVLNVLKTKPEDDLVINTVNKYGLIKPNKDRVLSFLKSEVYKYQPKSLKMENLTALIDSFSEGELSFVYYHCNLVHLFMDNNEKAQSWIASCLNTEDVEIDPNCKPEDLFALDEDLVVMLAPLVNYVLENRQVYKLPKEDPETAIWFTCLARRIESRINQWKDLLDLFVYLPVGIPDLEKKKNARRSVVILSDTDSVIFTTGKWVEWVTNDLICTDYAYGVSSFFVYLLSKLTAYNIERFATVRCANREKEETMQMKNEFTYPVLLLLDIKKNYVGIQTINEGLMLKEPDLDMKGGVLRGSDVVKEVVDFGRDLLVEDILIPCQTGEIDGQKVLNSVADIERRMLKSLNARNTEYLKMASVKMDSSEYKDWTRSTYFLYVFWQEVFAPKYGNINPPSKVPTISLHGQDQMYLKWLEEHHPDTYKRFTEFKDKYPNKKITSLVINPRCNEIPAELLPIVNLRKTVRDNGRAIYKILEQIGLSPGLNMDNGPMLVSDLV